MPYEPIVAVPLPTMPVAAPPVTVGSILGRTFSTWWKRMWIFAATTLVVMVPLYTVQLALYATVFATSYVPYGMAVSDRWPSRLFPIGFGILTVFALMVLACGHTHGAMLHLGGRPVRLGAMLSVAFGRLLALVGLAFLGGVAYVAFVFAVAAAAAFMTMTIGGFVTGLILVLVLLPLCCVVGTALSLTIPVMASERTGPITALRRSWVLTRGRRGAVFLSLLTISLILLASLFIQFFLMGLSMTAMMQYPEPRSDNTWIAVIAMVGLLAFFQVLLAPLFTLVPAVAYHDVRIEKEGVSTDELAQVFQ